MQPPGFSVRRASLDDLDEIRQYWKLTGVNPEELLPRLTEFQLAFDGAGRIQGALGLRIEQRQGFVRGESFRSPGLSDHLRPLLAERVLSVAKNHGLVRLWLLDPSDYWTTHGFAAPAPEQLEKLPAAFGEKEGSWRVSQLRAETDALLSIDQELDLFHQSQREATEQVLQQAQMFKTLAWVLVVLFGVVTGIVIIMALSNKPPL